MNSESYYIFALDNDQVHCLGNTKQLSTIYTRDIFWRLYILSRINRGTVSYVNGISRSIGRCHSMTKSYVSVAYNVLKPPVLREKLS